MRKIKQKIQRWFYKLTTPIVKGYDPLPIKDGADYLHDPSQLEKLGFKIEKCTGDCIIPIGEDNILHISFRYGKVTAYFSNRVLQYVIFLRKVETEYQVKKLYNALTDKYL
ncbi:hypothetical protein CMU41_05170 [Elizabethkingia anophelis]|nr:hypothetical protein [Elizabethkingia anophelis]MDV3766809.1 hypothetical protein [Elizabethkingia anophelis]HAY3505736.1 hypothetical protein [Elizabethkingia anophelis]